MSRKHSRVEQTRITKPSRPTTPAWSPSLGTVSNDAPATCAVSTLDDALFRHIVSSMRNGVLALNRDGSVAIINNEA